LSAYILFYHDMADDYNQYHIASLYNSIISLYSVFLGFAMIFPLLLENLVNSFVSCSSSALKMCIIIDQYFLGVPRGTGLCKVLFSFVRQTGICAIIFQYNLLSHFLADSCLSEQYWSITIRNNSYYSNNNKMCRIVNIEKPF